jgi:type II secretory pathway pseudopilin PulG
LDKFAEELKKLQKEIKDPTTLALMIIGVNTPRELVSRQMGNILLALLVPAVRQASDAETRSNVRRDQTLIAFALEEHKREHGQYPDTLDALAPKYLKTIPADRFSGKPLKYQRQDKGYLLYSVGANGQDDKGQDRNANPDSDDWSIRVPIPPEL